MLSYLTSDNTVKSVFICLDVYIGENMGTIRSVGQLVGSFRNGL
jgi:hypothetical protein